MESELIVIEHHCFVCGGALLDFHGSLLDSTKYSDKQIYKFLGKRNV